MLSGLFFSLFANVKDTSSIKLKRRTVQIKLLKKNRLKF